MEVEERQPLQTPGSLYVDSSSFLGGKDWFILICPQSPLCSQGDCSVIGGFLPHCFMGTGTHPLSALPHSDWPTFTFPASSLQCIEATYLSNAIQDDGCCQHNSELKSILN